MTPHAASNRFFSAENRRSADRRIERVRGGAWSTGRRTPGPRGAPAPAPAASRGAEPHDVIVLCFVPSARNGPVVAGQFGARHVGCLIAPGRGQQEELHVRPERARVERRGAADCANFFVGEDAFARPLMRFGFAPCRGRSATETRLNGWRTS